ncbi:MAG: heme exporter protein CcmD [Pseudomonadota bacterium]
MANLAECLQWLQMGGYSLYVWPSYAIVLGGFTAHWFWR